MKRMIAALSAAMLGAGSALAAEDAATLVLEVAGEAAGTIEIELLGEVAPNHVRQIKEIAESGQLDGVVFHRVIEGFMAQTGDVQHGRRGGDLSRAGTGGSSLPDLEAEFSEERFLRGTVGMARARHPDSANSQFFIMFADGEFLNGQYTLFGRVVAGMDVVDAIKLGDSARNGTVSDPDYIVRAWIKQDD